MVHVYLHTTYLLASILALALCASAAPTLSSSSPALFLRQADDNKPFDGPRTIQTHDVNPVTGGNIVEDCVVTLTPIVVNGRNLVREERRCTRLFVPNGNPLPPPPPPISTTVSTAPPGTPPPVVTTTPPPPSPPPPGSTTTTSDPANTSSSPPPANTNPPTNTNPGAGDQPPPSDPGATTPPGEPAGNTSDPNSPVVLGPSSVPADATNTPLPQTSGTRAANEGAPTPSSTDVIPGKKFEVLPIGLGVFAGISVIALIVVGLVTYERTKYRKAFRQRRLAASGAEMGYGGMSERR